MREKAVCFAEALKPEFKAYQHQVAANAKALAQALKDEGFKLLTDGTDNHLMLVTCAAWRCRARNCRTAVMRFISP